MIEIIVLLIFTISNIFCVWLGAKISSNEPLYSKQVDAEVVDAPDFVGAENG